jgi:rRNA maturation endonuclease Nob1
MTDDEETETLFTRRCPLCARLSDEKTCPYCGHGTVHYTVRLK